MNFIVQEQPLSSLYENLDQEDLSEFYHVQNNTRTYQDNRKMRMKKNTWDPRWLNGELQTLRLPRAHVFED